MGDAQRDAPLSPDPRIGQWTCIACRRRKIKCNKHLPCSNCITASLECITPSSGRTSSKTMSRSDPKRRYTERITEIEGILQSFQGSRGNKSPGGCNDRFPSGDDNEPIRKSSRVSYLNNTSGNRRAADNTPASDGRSLFPSGVIPNQVIKPDIETSLEHLFPEPGGGRYVNTCMLDILRREAGGPKMTLDLDVGQARPQTGSGIGFHLHSCQYQLLYIRHELVQPLWGYFKSRVDPIMKVLHVPSMEPIMIAASNLQPVSREDEALIFAICYVAISSLTDLECISEFGESQNALSAYHRLGCEQASARAGFIEATNLATMQAHLFYLAALRSEADAQAMWALMGLAARAAQSLGLHRDGLHWSGLSPFSIEMRRRLWWQLFELDMRISSEDSGRAPLIAEVRFDTQMPLNVNDADLSQTMTTFPESRIGLTEMTVSLVGFELTNTLRQVLLHWQEDDRQLSKDLPWQSSEEAHVSVIQSHRKIEQTYLANLDENEPLAWAASTYARLSMSKMWLVIAAPLETLHEIPNRSSDVGKLFLASLEAIEEGNRLDTNPRASQWRWYFGKSLQWHSLILLLSELSRQSSGDLVDRAWNAIEGLIRTRFEGEGNGAQRKVLLWQLVKRLLIKARMTREKKFLEESRLGGDGPYGGNRPLRGHPAIDNLLANESRI